MQKNIYYSLSKLVITLGLTSISVFVNTGVFEQIVFAKSINVKKCDISAYVTDPDPQGLNVRNGASLRHKILGQVPINETVQIIATAKNWVKITNASAGFSGTGWVSVAKLGLSSRGYATNGVNLYASANQQSLKIGKVPANATMKLLGCQGDWAQVEYQGSKGWLVKEDQCGAALTTCS
ncbi:SH3 type 3 domain-containing protein [Anabaenopsis circularis NIES-21]|uniref:SH3 type 3 domain-containing protein n=2 Tax=Nostocales TaxID=1161 RepID=A0A1Z4GMM8_9CYAN|nr:SH3 domain-containing protein [Nostoc cycadae]BAY18752.1 SH3 type 3 domain-containing protein [Anabaenopsis circularis NIES-21]GBE94705.1 SH3 type 3 domain-containing protein [Nostoc cycadae WK-1]